MAVNCLREPRLEINLESRVP